MKTNLSERLRQAADQHRAGNVVDDAKLSLQDLVRLHGESSLAVLLMLLAVVSVLPVAGAGTLMSFGMWAIAWSWVRERETLSLPPVWAPCLSMNAGVAVACMGWPGCTKAASA